METFFLNITNKAKSNSCNKIQKPFIQLVIWVVVMLFLPGLSYCQVNAKVVNLKSQVSLVKQNYDFWCTYACLEAVNGQDQCENCRSYLDGYIGNYYNAETDPYPVAMMTYARYFIAMNDFMNNNVSPCNNGEEFSMFGVLKPNMENFIGYEMYFVDFFSAISDPDIDISTPMFCASESGATGHCVLYTGSEVYSQNVEDPRSSVEFMDPFVGQEVTIPCKEFFETYWYYYFQN